MNKITLANILNQIGLLPMEEILKMSVGELIQYFNVADPAPLAAAPAPKEPNPYFRELYRNSPKLDFETPLMNAPFGVPMRSGDSIYIRTAKGHFAIKETSFAGTLHCFRHEGVNSTGTTFNDSDLTQLVESAVAQKPSKTPNFEKLALEATPIGSLKALEGVVMGCFILGTNIFVQTPYGALTLSAPPTRPGIVLFEMPQKLAEIIGHDADTSMLAADEKLADALHDLSGRVKKYHQEANAAAQAYPSFTYTLTHAPELSTKLTYGSIYASSDELIVPTRVESIRITKSSNPGELVFSMSDKAMELLGYKARPVLVKDHQLHVVLASTVEALDTKLAAAEQDEIDKASKNKVMQFIRARADSGHVFTQPNDVFMMMCGEDCQTSVSLYEGCDFMMYAKTTPQRIRVVGLIHDQSPDSTDNGQPKFYYQELPLELPAARPDWAIPPTPGELGGWSEVSLPDELTVMETFEMAVARDFDPTATNINETVDVPVKAKSPVTRWGNALHAHLFQERAPMKDEPAPEVIGESVRTMLLEKTDDNWTSDEVVPAETRDVVVVALDEDFHVAIENVSKQSGMKGLDLISLEFVQDDCRFLLQSLLAAIPAVTSHIPLIPLRGNGVWSKFIDKSQRELAVFVHIADTRYELHYTDGKITIYQSNVEEAPTTLDAVNAKLPPAIFIQLYVSILARAILLGHEPVDIKNLMVHSAAILKSWRDRPEFNQ